jgi:putative intracellular protease/amidase
MPKVLMLTGDAGESLEVLYPYQRLREEGYDVDVAAPTKKRLQLVVHAQRGRLCPVPAPADALNASRART